jgi:hypothetical protein
MAKVHNGIEYKGGEKVYATGTSRVGMVRGTVIGFTKSGQFKVEADSDTHVPGMVIRTHWVSPRD